ncbi:glutathione S-transferase [Dendrothele bispora CBS 962.96]|uniref:Glutathione S-transferase n=1 Tax=Dendrothele bispora (strain CBS 962.96) TaxID=1314807 RepID=A0A4S8MPF1_DENBC|nr:glutathione S-transferase [Dendrothele bispora CBS 962.96]
MANRDVSNQSDISKSKMSTDGSFNRAPSSFRNFIAKGGKFEAEADRYHLYVSYACPWATRALIVRKLKGLEKIISVTVVSPRMGNNGWPFATADQFPDADADPLYKSEHIKDLYLRCAPDYAGRFTVPVLWDKKLETIVNNESSEIIRMFNSEFNDLVAPEYASVDLYPEAHRKEIDELNEWIYPTINNGVYRSGFATSQTAYETAVKELFASLDKVEKLLTGKDYIVGNKLTECDVRLWVTIIRFDPVYVGHFKCNIRDIRNGYPAINEWCKKLYWNSDAFKSSTNFDHIKTHYYWSHPHLNPTRNVPVGPIPHIQPL